MLVLDHCDHSSAAAACFDNNACRSARPHVCGAAGPRRPLLTMMCKFLSFEDVCPDTIWKPVKLHLAGGCRLKYDGCAEKTASWSCALVVTCVCRRWKTRRRSIHRQRVGKGSNIEPAFSASCKLFGMYICIYIYIYTCMCNMCVYIHIYIYIYVYAHMYTYIHTHICSCIWPRRRARRRPPSGQHRGRGGAGEALRLRLDVSLLFAWLLFVLLLVILLWLVLLWNVLMYSSTILSSEGGMIRLETLAELEILSAFRAYPLIETRQAVSCRAIRGNSISVDSSTTTTTTSIHIMNNSHTANGFSYAASFLVA